jgi:hypothetical protein
MTARSSAWFISYDLRPGKQIERRIVLDSLQAAKASGLPIEAFPFVGMGGVRYIDFLMANRVIGSRKFVSIEHDGDLIPRCEFNKPFHDLQIFSGTASEFIQNNGFSGPSIVWFDYERAISTDLSDDMVALSASVAAGSFVFLTATAELPPNIRAIKGLEKRVTKIKEDLGVFADRVSATDMSPDNFRKTAAQILRAALSFGFAGRADGEFYPFLKLNYRDTTWMMTIGGYFGSKDEIVRLRKAFKGRCDFLKPNNQDFIYTVEQFNITDAERRLFDRAAIAQKSRRAERMILKRLGFRKTILDQYDELMRFIPRYFESVL